MIEDPETAKCLCQLMLSINERLDESILMVEKGASPQELKAYKHAIGYVLYEIFDKILEPLYWRYPSLKPPEAAEPSSS